MNLADVIIIGKGPAGISASLYTQRANTENNEVLVDYKQSTNIEGIFAAGDCTGGFKQIATAVGQGAVAGKSIIEFVRTLKNEE